MDDLKDQHCKLFRDRLQIICLADRYDKQLAKASKQNFKELILLVEYFDHEFTH